MAPTRSLCFLSFISAPVGTLGEESQFKPVVIHQSANTGNFMSNADGRLPSLVQLVGKNGFQIITRLCVA